MHLFVTSRHKVRRLARDKLSAKGPSAVTRVDPNNNHPATVVYRSLSALISDRGEPDNTLSSLSIHGSNRPAGYKSKSDRMKRSQS